MDTTRKTSLRVLLVEDDPTFAMLIQQILARAKGDALPVERVDRLARASAVLAEKHFDVVLLDLNLPDSSGLQTVSHMRAISPALPIVVLTGVDDRETALKAIRAGAQDYLTKEQIDGNFLVRSMRYAMARKREECRLQQAEAAAVAANQAKGVYIDALSVRLCRPIAAIWGAAHELTQNLEDDPVRRAHLEAIVRHSAATMNLVEEMMDHAGSRELAAFGPAVQCDPHLLANEAASMLQPRSASKKLALVMEYGRALPRYIRTHPQLLHNALFKLIANAIKHTTSGTVIVRTSMEWSESNPQICFEVHDNGPGLPAAVLAEVFQQNPASAGRAAEAFGLPALRRIAHELGGSLVARARGGGGSIIGLSVRTGPLNGVELLEHQAHPAYSPASRPLESAPQGAAGAAVSDAKPAPAAGPASAPATPEPDAAPAEPLERQACSA